MSTFRTVSIVIALIGMLAITEADAQHYHQDQHQHQDQHYSPGYHIDHHDHVIQDSHGHTIGQYHHDVVHQNSTYVLPYTGHQNHGTYFQSEGSSYYYPQTASANPAHYQSTQPVSVQFGGFSHVDDLASRLESLSNEFCLDLHYNYPHNPGFRETYSEAYQILQVAQFIHAAEHQQDRPAIASRLQGLDALFHHVEDDVRGWQRHHHRQVGQLGIMAKMDLIESTLHHLMNDVGVHATGAGQQAPTTQGNGLEQAPTPAGVAPGALSSQPPGF